MSETTTTARTATELISDGLRAQAAPAVARTALPDGWERLSPTEKIRLGIAADAGLPIPAELTARAAHLAAQSMQLMGPDGRPIAGGGGGGGAGGPAMGPAAGSAAMNVRPATATELIAQGLHQQKHGMTYGEAARAADGR